MSATPPEHPGTDALKTPARRFLLRSAILIGFATIASRILGFWREATVTGLFAGTDTDAFYMAFAIPDMVRYLLLAGILSAIFIPLFAQVAAERGMEQAKLMAGQFLSLSTLVAVVAAILGVLLAPQIIEFTAVVAPSKDQNPALKPLAIELTRLLFPMMIFSGLTGLLQAIFNSLHDYRTPAWAPVWFNIVFIVGMGGLALAAGRIPELAPYITPQTMSVVTVAGAAMQVLVQLPSLKRQGVWFRSPLIRDPAWRQFIALVPAAFIGYSALVTNSFVDKSFAFGMGEAQNTALYLSQRVQQLPTGVFSITLVTALFPTIAQKLKLGQPTEAMADCYLALRLCALTLLPSTVFLALWSTPIIRLLFHHGKFAENPETLALTASALAAYALALFTTGGSLFTTRTFFAINDRRTPVILGLLIIVLNYAADWLFAVVLDYGIPGLARSNLLVTSVTLFGGLAVLQRRFPEIRGWALRIESLRVLALGGLYWGFAWGLRWLCETLFPSLTAASASVPKPIDMLYLVVVLLVSLGFLIGAATLLKMEEMATIRRILARRRGRETAEPVPALDLPQDPTST